MIDHGDWRYANHGILGGLPEGHPAHPLRARFLPQRGHSVPAGYSKASVTKALAGLYTAGLAEVVARDVRLTPEGERIARRTPWPSLSSVCRRRSS